MGVGAANHSPALVGRALRTCRADPAVEENDAGQSWLWTCAGRPWCGAIIPWCAWTQEMIASLSSCSAYFALIIAHSMARPAKTCQTCQNVPKLSKHAKDLHLVDATSERRHIQSW